MLRYFIPESTMSVTIFAFEPSCSPILIAAITFATPRNDAAVPTE